LRLLLQGKIKRSLLPGGGAIRVALPLKQRMIACSTSAKRKDKDSHQYDLEPPLKRQMGRVEDYLHRISMYIGNLQKSADWEQGHKTVNAHTRDEMKLLPPHTSIVVSLVK